MFRKILLVLLVLFIVIQFFRPAKNLSAQPSANDISTMVTVPADVQTILNKACYDCHSNNTRYPWYAEVQPVAWWLNSHIIDGKRHLNFNEFRSYRLWRQYEKLEETIDLVKKDEMPLTSYKIVHTDAKLNETEKQKLIVWAESMRANMKATYPADSLRKRSRLKN